MSDTTTNATVTVRLTNGKFEDLYSTIRALLFGEMVKRATPVIRAYHSDLFHDAVWLTTYVDGPTSFHWLVTDCGTHVEGAALAVAKNHPSQYTVLYRVELTQDDRDLWLATFTTVPLDQA